MNKAELAAPVLCDPARLVGHSMALLGARNVPRRDVGALFSWCRHENTRVHRESADRSVHFLPAQAQSAGTAQAGAEIGLEFVRAAAIGQKINGISILVDRLYSG